MKLNFKKIGEGKPLLILHGLFGSSDNWGTLGKKFAENNSPYDSPHYRKSKNNKYWVVYNKSTGKILKNYKYTPASFKTMLKSDE